MSLVDADTGEIVEAAFGQIREAEGRQIMPELEREIAAALRESILRFGVIVPIAVDQHGDIIDGHNRWEIANELGVPCPSMTHHCADEKEARELAESLNMDRRQMDRAARQQIAKSLRESGYGIVAIAEALGVGKSTIARDLDEQTEGEQQFSRDGKTAPAPTTTTTDGKLHPAKKRRWTSDDLIELLKRRESGETVKQLAAEYGCVESMIHERIRAAKKLRDGQTTPTGRSADEVREREDKVREMAAAGSTSRQIAKALDIGEAAVRRIAKRIGVEITADKVAGNTRRHDSNRIVTESAITLEAVVSTLDLADPTDLDVAQVAEWVASFTRSIQSLNRFNKQMKEMTRGEQ